MSSGPRPRQTTSQNPEKQRLIILSWIQDYLDEFEHYRLWPCAKAIQGSESGWRTRVGVYRILGRFEGRKAIIEVVRVGHQGVYKNIPRIKTTQSQTDLLRQPPPVTAGDAFVEPR